jgi:hypothetical protein
MVWEEKIISRQCPSTQALMLAQNARPEEEDGAYITRIKFTPVDMSAQCKKEDGSIDLNVRAATIEEMDLHDRFRRRRGSLIELIRGSGGVSTLSDDKRERAIDSFMRKTTLGAIADRFKKIMSEMFKPSYAEVMAEAIKKAKDEK